MAQRLYSSHSKNKVFDKIHIIGCGYVGSLLAIRLLTNTTICDEVCIYDSSRVSERNNYYPFDNNEGLLKTEVVESISKTNVGVKLSKFGNLDNDIECDSIRSVIVDTRDNNSPILKSDIKVSFSGNILQLDCRPTKTVSVNGYFFKRNSNSARDQMISLITSAMEEYFHLAKKLLIYHFHKDLNCYLPVDSSRDIFTDIDKILKVDLRNIKTIKVVKRLDDEIVSDNLTLTKTSIRISKNDLCRLKEMINSLIINDENVLDSLTKTKTLKTIELLYFVKYRKTVIEIHLHPLDGSA